MSSRVANIVVTCTKRKAVPADDDLQLGRIDGSTVRDLAKEWIGRLKKSTSAARPANELYCGDHWRIACELPQVAMDHNVKVRLWVCSAGYGLIPAWAPLKPYSATFSSPHKDSVLTHLNRLGGANIRDWWVQLAKWKGPVTGQPRTLSDLARDSKRSPLIFVASDIYLQAVGTDLEDARNVLADPSLLTIVSGSGSPSNGLRPNLLPCNARLQPLLGGALMSLNVRVVRRILSTIERWPLRCDQLSTEFQGLIDTQSELDQPIRQQMTDKAIRQFIQRKLTQNPLMCVSPLLRQYRDSGFACEQKRFGRLFLEVRKRFHE